MKHALLLILLLTAPLGIEASEVPKLRGLSRTELLEYREPSGKVAQGKTVQAWNLRRKEALEAFQHFIGPIPKPDRQSPPTVRLLEEVDCGTYVRQRIEYLAFDHAWVPAFLCIPKTASPEHPAPAVLCLHPTQNEIGYEVVVGLGGKPNRQYAAELAERGFVTLSPSYPLLAKYQPNLKALGFTTGTAKAISDTQRGADLLEHLPYVTNKLGFGVIGHSLGGHHAIFTAALDERFTVVVSSCGFDSLLDYKDGNLKGYVQERYMLNMADHLSDPSSVPWDYVELIASLAPRVFFANAPKQDSNFKWDSVERIRQAASRIYQLHGASERLQIRYPNADHDFPEAVRFEAYENLEKALR